MIPDVYKEGPGKLTIDTSKAMLVVLVSHQGGDPIPDKFKEPLWPKLKTYVWRCLICPRC